MAAIRLRTSAPTPDPDGGEQRRSRRSPPASVRHSSLSVQVERAALRPANQAIVAASAVDRADEAEAEPGDA